MLINKDAILNSEIFNYPWEHQIVDNFLNETIFEKIRLSCKLLLDKENIRKYPLLVKKLKQASFGSWDLSQEFHIYDLINSGIPEKIVELIYDCSQEFLYLLPQLHQKYSNPRKFNSYHVVPKLNMDFPGLPRDIHDESERKSISVVLYLDPDENESTSLHIDNSEESIVKIPEWKPNRALIFCGEVGKTWHSYQVIGKKPRFVLVIFVENFQSDIPLFTYKFSNGKIATLPDENFNQIGISYKTQMEKNFNTPYIKNSGYLYPTFKLSTDP